MLDGYLDIEQLMTRLDIGRTNAFSLVSRKYGEPQLESFKVAGKRWIKESIVEDFVQQLADESQATIDFHAKLLKGGVKHE